MNASGLSGSPTPLVKHKTEKRNILLSRDPSYHKHSVINEKWNKNFNKEQKQHDGQGNLFSIPIKSKFNSWLSFKPVA